MAKKIQLIIGSTRQNRLAPQIAAWVEKQTAQNTDITLEVVDLQDWQLPFMDAPTPPAYAAVDTPEARKWAAQIAGADGYIFLTAEDNRGIPAPLKNALDYLVAEWKGKPATIISYGYIDGGQSAARHLADVAAWLKLRTTPPVGLRLGSKDDFNEDGSFKDIDKLFSDQAEGLQVALAELAA